MKSIFVCIGALLLCIMPVSSMANTTVSERDRALLDAVSRGNKDRATQLLKEGADINAQLLPWHLTPLLIASDTQPDMIRYLVARGADVNARDRDGLTPLMKAIAVRDPALIVLLLDAGAHIDARDNRGHTALTHAVLRSHPEILALLLERGAERDVVTTMGTTPWSMAQEMRTAAVRMREHAHAMSAHHDSDHVAHAHAGPKPPAHPMRSKDEALSQTQAVLDLLQSAGATRPRQTVKNFDAMEHHHRH